MTYRSDVDALDARHDAISHDLAAKTGYIGPHTYYALPGRMLVQGLSNAKDKGGITGMALYNNKGKKTEVEFLEDGKPKPEEK